jgi:hypothetical protein
MWLLPASSMVAEGRTYLVGGISTTISTGNELMRGRGDEVLDFAAANFWH